MSKDKICSLLSEAIQDEAGAPKLYNKLIAALKDPDDKRITQEIIGQENLHKVDFERMFKKNKCRKKKGSGKKVKAQSCIPAALPL